jgi:hypothetical protein
VQDYSPKPAYFAPLDVFAIASDGAVLTTALAGPTHVYRLPAISTTWQDLGPMPDTAGASPAYYPTTSGDVFWYNGDRLYTAAYPPA